MPKSPYTLYKQDRSPNWSVRFTVDEKVIRKSLKTEDETEARTKAQKIYYDIILKKEAGININFSTFDSFIDHYIKHKDSKKKDCNFNLIFSVVIKKFFQNKKPNEISQEYINRYPDFRRTFGRTYTGRKYKLRKEIADGTIKLEINWINSFLGYCERQRFVTDIPRIKTNIQITRRSAFNDTEIKVVRNQLEEDIEYARRGFGKQLIKYYFEFLLYTGCRPCEWFNLKWQNINTTDDLITIFVHGKNKQRELVALPEIRLILSNLYKMQTKR
ncbi:site-specific integrase, partial [Gluconobacter albidus]